MKTRKVLLFALVTAIQAACAPSGGSDSNSSEGKQTIAEQMLKGNWKDSCQSWGEGEYLQSSYSVVSVEGSAVKTSVHDFASSDCTGEKTRVMSVTFTFTIPSRSVLGPDIYNVDSVYRGVTEVVLDQDTANMYNTGAHCGYTDWIVGIEKDVTDKSCMTGLKAGEASYVIMKITETQLQAGEPDDVHTGKTPELRFVKLGANVFSKIE